MSHPGVLLLLSEYSLLLDQLRKREITLPLLFLHYSYFLHLDLILIYVIFLFHEELLLTFPCKAGLLAMNSLSFC